MTEPKAFLVAESVLSAPENEDYVEWVECHRYNSPSGGAAMITAVVNFKLPADIDAKKARELYKGSTPKYRGLKGLVRKYYLFDGEKRIGGGVYLWKSRADAEALYTPEWKAWARERYGAEPDIRYYDTWFVVDNESDKVLDAAAD